MSKRRRRRLTATLSVGLVLLLGAGYAAADAADVVPGILTTQEPIPEPADFPQPAPITPADPQVPSLDPAAPPPDADELAALSSSLIQDVRSGGDVGVVVSDALTAEVLVDLGGAQPRTPASSLKLLGAVAVLDALGPSHVLQTRAVRDAEGRVVLVGGGDILLTDGPADPTGVVGRASLQDLAAQVARSLGDDGAVSVAVDDSLFAGPRYASGWGGIDFNYVMAIQSLAVEAGVRDSGGYEEDPALAAGRSFAEALRAQGVEVIGEVARATAGADDAELGVVESAPLRDVVGYTLAVSENSLAEVLARLVAIADGEEATFAGASRAVVARLASLGIDTSGVTLADNSGLLIENRVPAGVLADVVATALDRQRPELRGAVTGLPVAALEGTLSGRMHGPAAGVLRAKTGTLTTAVSLTGIVQDTGGRLLVFAVVADELELGGVGPARAAIDDWAAALVTCDCR